MRRAAILLAFALPIPLGAQHAISIDGQFDDWRDVPTYVVERTGAVAGAGWVEFATVAGDGTTVVISVPDLHAAEYFRVLSQPVLSRSW